MSNEQLFGSGLYKDGRADHDGLKLVLHRYIIDAIEETGKTCWKVPACLWPNLLPSGWPSMCRACI